MKSALTSGRISKSWKVAFMQFLSTNPPELVEGLLGWQTYFGNANSWKPVSQDARKYVKLNHWNSSLEIRYLCQQLQVTDIITCQLNPLFSCLPFETIFGDKSPNVDLSDIMTPLLLMQ